MAAPTPTTRIDPATVGAIMMDNGFPFRITFARFPSVKFKEKTGNPPGFDGGAPSETATQFNSRYLTFAPRKLMKMTEVKVVVAFDSWVLQQIPEMININDQITWWFPDGSSYAFWGFLNKMDIKSMEDGKQVEADITIMPTMRDNLGAEQGPVLAEVTGT